MSSQPKIALLHHTGAGNLGDDATLQVVLQSIKQRWLGAEVIALSINPDDTGKRHGIPSYPASTYTWSFGYHPPQDATTFKESVKALVKRHTLLFRILGIINALAIRLPKTLFRELAFLVSSYRIIRRFDCLIICGGGQLTERDGPWAFPYTIFRWTFLAKLARTKCVFLNVGAGPLTRPLSKAFARRALDAAEYVSFRDDQSQLLARAIGFTGESRVFPDSAYHLDVNAFHTHDAGKRVQPIVGIAPLPYGDPRLGPAEGNESVYHAYIDKFATFASRLAEDSYSLALFGSDIGIDPLAIVDLHAVLRNRYNVHAVRSDSVRSVEELLSKISAMDYVVTCRFHAVVFAHLLNKPVLAISHHPKVTKLMSDLGLAKYCLDIRTFDANLMIERFSSMVCAAHEIKDSMAVSLAAYKSQLAAQFGELFPKLYQGASRFPSKVAATAASRDGC